MRSANTLVDHGFPLTARMRGVWMRLREGIIAGFAIPAIDSDIVAPIAKPDAAISRTLETTSGFVEIARRKLLERKGSPAPYDVLAKSVIGTWYCCSNTIGWRHLVTSTLTFIPPLAGDRSKIPTVQPLLLQSRSSCGCALSSDPAQGWHSEPAACDPRRYSQEPASAGS